MRSWLTTFSLAALLAASCAGAIQNAGNNTTVKGSGVLRTETRQVGEFSGVDVRSIIHAKIKVGEKTAVEVSGDDNLLPLFETEVRDGRLIAKIKDNSGVSTNLSLKLTVTTPRLESLSTDGVARVEAAGASGKSLRFEATGASNIAVTGAASDSVTVKVEGSSHVTLAGQGKQLALDVSGASQFHAADFTTESVEAKLDGVAKVEVRASDAVKGSVGGASALSVRGNPATRSVTTSGVGKVTYEPDGGAK